MKKHYFDHDFTAHQDDKIISLLHKMGYEGYGLYWALVEYLYLNEGIVTFDCERIAFALRTESDKIATLVNDFDLFEIKGNALTAQRIRIKLNEIKSKSDKAKKAAKERWSKELRSHANAMQTQCDSNAIRTKEEKRRTKEEKKKREGRKKTFTPPSLQTVRDYIKDHGYGVDAENFLDFYQSKNWMVGKNKMKDWQAAIRTWERRGSGRSGGRKRELKSDWADIQEQFCNGGDNAGQADIWAGAKNNGGDAWME